MLTVELHKEVINFLDITGIVYNYADGSKAYQVNNSLYKSTDIEGLFTVQFISTDYDNN